jgi:hypothetical protein
MPTVLLINGWRLFFYANENNEPPHIHARNGDSECKFWLSVSKFDIEEVYFYNSSPKLKKQIRKIIFEHLEYLVQEYRKIHKDHE